MEISIVIKGEAKEIAALALAAQERRVNYEALLPVIFTVTHGCLRNAEAKDDT